MFKLEHENDTKKILKLDSDNCGEIDDIININRKPKITQTQSVIVEESDAGLDFIANETKRKQETYSDSINESQNNEDFMGNFGESVEDQEEDDEPILSHEELQQQKAYYLSQLHRLEQKGSFASRKLGIEHPLNVIKGEYLRIKKEKEIDNGIQYCRTGLMFCVSTIEMFNNKYDPFSVDLDGWSNVIMSQKDDYDLVFEELYEKYHSKMAVAPEFKLIAMVAGSALMFSLQKSLMNKQANKNPLSNIMNSFMNSKKPEEPIQGQGMRGPSIDTESLLNKLNDDSESDVSSIISDISVVEQSKPDVKTVKTRGRPKKNKN